MYSAAGRVDVEADVVPDAGGDYDVVLVAVRRDQLASACAELAVLAGKPAVVFFGNNPSGRRPSPATCPAMSTSGSPASAASWPAGPPTTSASGSSPRRCRGS
jgi:hypothetical protein